MRCFEPKFGLFETEKGGGGRLLGPGRLKGHLRYVKTQIKILRLKKHIDLGVICIQMMGHTKARYYMAKWRCVQGKK